jgi:hypothetical protein
VNRLAKIRKGKFGLFKFGSTMAQIQEGVKVTNRLVKALKRERSCDRKPLIRANETLIGEGN